MAEPQYYEYKEDRELPDGDYILRDGAGWFTVRNLSVRIRATDDRVEVDIYPLHREAEESIASAYAFFADAEEEPV